MAKTNKNKNKSKPVKPAAKDASKRTTDKITIKPLTKTAIPENKEIPQKVAPQKVIKPFERTGDEMVELMERIDRGEEMPPIENEQTDKETITAPVPPVGNQKPEASTEFKKITEIDNGLEIEFEGAKISVKQSPNGAYIVESVTIVPKTVTIATFNPVDLSVYDDKESGNRLAYVRIKMSRKTAETIARAFVKLNKAKQESKV